MLDRKKIKTFQVWGVYISPTPIWAREVGNFLVCLMGREEGVKTPRFVAVYDIKASSIDDTAAILEALKRFPPGKRIRHLCEGSRRWIPRTDGPLGAVWANIEKEL